MKNCNNKKRTRFVRKLLHLAGLICMFGCGYLEIRIYRANPTAVSQIMVVAAAGLLCISYLLPFLLHGLGKRIWYRFAGLSTIDRMTGEEFEQFLASYYRSVGYHVQLTRATGDFGVDLVLSKRQGLKREVTVVQAKRYSRPVGIAAVQEVIGGKLYYNAQHMVVATNSHFTKAAVALAQKSDVTLLERADIARMCHKGIRQQVRDGKVGALSHR